MTGQQKEVPDSSAVRTALWRAMHVLVDAPPHVLEDEVGLQLAAPDEHWRDRPDMHPQGTAPFRAAIVSRARFIEDLVAAEAEKGVEQYVILGAGLDTFAQRRPEIASRLHVFEIDQPETSAWKRGRLIELGYGVPDWLRLVPVDFEARQDWWARAGRSGIRCRRARGDHLYRRDDVREQGGDGGHATTDGRPRYWVDAGDDVPAHSRPRGRSRPSRPGHVGTRRATIRHAVHQLLQAGRDVGDGARGRLQGRATRLR